MIYQFDSRVRYSEVMRIAGSHFFYIKLFSGLQQLSFGKNRRWD